MPDAPQKTQTTAGSAMVVDNLAPPKPAAPKPAASYNMAEDDNMEVDSTAKKRRRRRKRKVATPAPLQASAAAPAAAQPHSRRLADTLEVPGRDKRTSSRSPRRPSQPDFTQNESIAMATPSAAFAERVLREIADPELDEHGIMTAGAVRIAALRQQEMQRELVRHSARSMSSPWGSGAS